MKKQEEAVEKPSIITYHVAVPEIADELLEALKSPIAGVNVSLKRKSELVISYGRQLSMDEAVYIGAIIGKWEQKLMDKLKQSIQKTN